MCQGGGLPWCRDPTSSGTLRRHSDHAEEVIGAEAKQAGAERYLASFPLVGHRGPWPPWCARQSSRYSDRSQSRQGARETVLGRSLRKINTLRDSATQARQSTPSTRSRGVAKPKGQRLEPLPAWRHCLPPHPIAPSSGHLPTCTPAGPQALGGGGGHSQVQRGWEACRSYEDRCRGHRAVPGTCHTPGAGQTVSPSGSLWQDQIHGISKGAPHTLPLLAWGALARGRLGRAASDAPGPAPLHMQLRQGGRREGGRAASSHCLSPRDHGNLWGLG